MGQFPAAFPWLPGWCDLRQEQRQALVSELAD